MVRWWLSLAGMQFVNSWCSAYARRVFGFGLLVELCLRGIGAGRCCSCWCPASSTARTQIWIAIMASTAAMRPAMVGVVTRIDAFRQVAAVTAVTAAMVAPTAATQVAPRVFRHLPLTARAARQAACCRCKKQTAHRARERRKNLPRSETAARA